MAKQSFLTACAVSALAIATATPALAQTAGAAQTDSAQSTPPPGATTASGEEQSSQSTIGGNNGTDANSTDRQGAETASNGDIVVTAQGRAQVLSNVPVAVSVVNAASLERTGASDIRQITQVTPSLQVSSTGTEANGSARLRGIGTVGDNPGLESSVAVFIDGVYRSRSGVGLNELGDIERVEVLRGPQGTLFGRNASAGIISIVSKSPDLNRVSAGAEASYGNYNFLRLGGNLNVPLGEIAAARVDGVYVKRDGFLKDVNNGVRVNDRDRYFVRGQLLLEPSAALSVRLIGDYTHRSEACCGAVFIDRTVAPANGALTTTANPIIPVLLALGEPAAALSNPYSRNIYVNKGRSYAGLTTDYGFSGQIDYDFGGAKLTSITGYRYYNNSGGSDTDYTAVDLLYRDPTKANFRQFKTFSQEVRLQGTAFNDKLDWLIGGYYSNEDLTTNDTLKFGAQYGRFTACRILVSGALAGVASPSSPGCIAPAARAVIAGAGGAESLAAFDRQDTVANVGSTGSGFKQNSNNYAFFTHNIFEIADGLKLTLGGRYTHERKTLTGSFGNNNSVCPAQQAALGAFVASAGTRSAAQQATGQALLGALATLACQFNFTTEINGKSVNDRRSENKFTGTAILSYKVTPDLLVYGSVARGYKAGGFNLDQSALKAPLTPFGAGGPQAFVKALQFEEEINTAFEIGAKFSTPGFSLNVAGFRQEFDNFQLNTFNGAFFLVQNINGCKTNLNGADRDTDNATGACAPDQVQPGVISQGVEIEASLNPTRNLNFAAGLTYADTHYRNNLVGTSNGAPLVNDLRLLPGDNLSNAPDLVVTTSLTWTPPIGDTGLSGLFYIDQRTSSDYNTGSDLAPQKEQDSFTVVNARVGIRGPKSRWALEFWAQNLTNTNYTQVAFNTPFVAGPSNTANFPLAQFPKGTQTFSAYLAEPRTYGATVRFRF